MTRQSTGVLEVKKNISQSTHEAEAVALSDTTKEAIWMKDLLVNSGDWNQQHETTIYSDNESLIKALARTDYYVSARTKHLRVDLAAIREGVKYENFIIKHVASALNRADLFTKPLTTDGFHSQVELAHKRHSDEERVLNVL